MPAVVSLQIQKVAGTVSGGSTATVVGLQETHKMSNFEGVVWNNVFSWVWQQR